MSSLPDRQDHFTVSYGAAGLAMDGLVVCHNLAEMNFHITLVRACQGELYCAKHRLAEVYEIVSLIFLRD